MEKEKQQQEEKENSDSSQEGKDKHRERQATKDVMDAYLRKAFKLGKRLNEHESLVVTRAFLPSKQRVIHLGLSLVRTYIVPFDVCVSCVHADEASCGR